MKPRRFLIPDPEPSCKGIALLFASISNRTQLEEKARPTPRTLPLSRWWNLFFEKYVRPQMHMGNPSYRRAFDRAAKRKQWEKRNPVEAMLRRKAYAAVAFVVLVVGLWDIATRMTGCLLRTLK